MTTIQIKVQNCLNLIFVSPILLYRLLRFGYTYRRIWLGEGEWTILDQKDYCRLCNLKWHVGGNGNNYYAIRDVKKGNYRIKIISLHREIMNAPAGLLVDHRNNNTLDNRKENLRLATHSQNQFNKRKTTKETASRFIGVYLEKESSRWFGRIGVNGKRKWLGYSDNEIEAAKTYDRAAIKYHGEFAHLNFPREDYNVEIRATNDL